MLRIKFLYLDIPVVTLSTQDNAKLLSQLKSGFKRTISWNKYLTKPELLAQIANLNHLTEPSFQSVNRPFVLAFENDGQRITKEIYYIPNAKLKEYNVMVDGKSFFDQPVKKDKVKRMTISEKLLLVKEMITRLAVC